MATDNSTVQHSTEEAKARLMALLKTMTPEEQDKLWSEFRPSHIHEPDAEDIRRAEVVLGEIAMLAKQAQCVLREAMEHSTWETSLAGRLMGAADSLVGQIGFCADLGNEALGGKLAVRTGGAEAWLMPPTYHGEEAEALEPA